MEALNRSLYLMFNAGDHPSFAVLCLAKVLAQQAIILLPLLLVLLWLRGARTAAVTAVLCVLLALLGNVLIGLLFMHPRPFMVPLGHSWISHRAETSFPSDHATIFFAFGLALCAAGLRRLGAVVAALGVAVGWSRVYLGVHFPFDIIGGLLVAIASTWAMVTLLAWRNLGTRLVDRLEHAHRALLKMPLGRQRK